jgi:cytoskeletal protein RodZ
MSYPNSALPTWQIVMIAVVVIAALAAWLLLVYSAAREPRTREVQPAAESPPTPTARPEEPAKPEREVAA